MKAVEATTVEEFTLRAFPSDPAAPGPDQALDSVSAADLSAARLRNTRLSAARLRNTRLYAEQVLHDPRYTQAANAQAPRKIGSHLTLFDCVSCDKCVPVCPNDANFTFPTMFTELPKVRVEPNGDTWTWVREGVLPLTQKHQIGTFADFCNECGNCDVFCPEDGGPYKIKPHFFGSRAGWEAARPHEGLVIEQRAGSSRVLGRCDGTEFQLDVIGEQFEFTGPGFRVRFEENDPEGTLNVQGTGVIDITWCFILNNIRLGVLAGAPTNYINMLPEMSRGES